jgi:hypothetical protein
MGKGAGEIMGEKVEVDIEGNQCHCNSRGDWI